MTQRVKLRAKWIQPCAQKGKRQTTEVYSQALKPNVCLARLLNCLLWNTHPATALLNCPLPTHGSLWSAGQSPKVMEQHLGPFRTSFRFVAHFLFHPAKAPCTPSSGPFSVQVGTLWLLLPSPGCWLCLKFPPLSDHSPSQHKYFTYPSPKLQIT